MDDLHFMERLERLGWRETELALRLYREPEMVKLLLDDAKAPEAERVAIALSAGPSPPHVVVARDGAFVTALAAGMTPGDLPVVPHARIALAADRHEALKGKLAYIDWAAENPGSLRRLWRAVLNAGARLPREVIVALAPVAPLYGPTAEALTFELRERVTALATDRPNRYLRDGVRFTARDLDALENLWRTHWATAHLVGLAGYCDRSFFDILATECRRSASALLYGMPAMTFGDLPAMLRVGWMAARAGAPVMRLAQGFLTAETPPTELDALGASLQLAFVGAAHSRLRAEAQKALGSPVRIHGHEPSVTARRRIYAELLDPSPLASFEAARAYLVDFLGAVIAARHEAPSTQQVITARQEPLALALVSLLPVNLYRDLRTAIALLRGLAWFARCDLADFYVPEASLASIAPWQPEDTLKLLRGSLSYGTFFSAAPKPQPPRPGRNDPCPCGSGKKYKRCCGA